jgi:acetylornithine deacetylase/succinyl-diaminopimelate desuccinylase-like protein
MKPLPNNPPLYARPAEILQKLIQFNTTNPPGNEGECIAYIRGLLSEAGIDSTVVARTANHPNLIARLPGSGKAAPILLYGHVDVVTAENQKWDHPPFEGKLVDGFVWGRGALDMKGGVAMMLAAFLRAKAEGLQPAGDIILTIVSDEEAGGEFGAKFLVEKHAELFEGVRYALGEFGGFTFQVGKRRFYPIMVAEKQACWMKATVRGAGGHGSMPVRGGAMARLASLLRRLDEHSLPVHVSPSVRLMIESMASAMVGVQGLVLRQLAQPALTNGVLNLLGERGRLFNPLVHNTVSPTMLQGSAAINVIPGEISVGLDGRLLPGFKPEDMIRELRPIIGADVELEVVQFDPGPADMGLGLFDMLANILRESDPEGVPIPLLLSGVTDARFFSRLGIQTHGFLPMTLPEDFNFTATIHAANERIPVAAVEFGANAIFKALQRYG